MTGSLPCHKSRYAVADLYCHYAFLCILSQKFDFSEGAFLFNFFCIPDFTALGSITKRFHCQQFYGLLIHGSVNINADSL